MLIDALVILVLAFFAVVAIWANWCDYRDGVQRYYRIRRLEQ